MIHFSCFHTSSFGHKRRDGFALLFFRRFVRAYGFRFEEFESCHPNYGELFLPTKSCEVCVCMIKQCFTLGGIIYPTNLYVFTMHHMVYLPYQTPSTLYVLSRFIVSIFCSFISEAQNSCHNVCFRTSMTNLLLLCLAYISVFTGLRRATALSM